MFYVTEYLHTFVSRYGKQLLVTAIALFWMSLFGLTLVQSMTALAIIHLLNRKGDAMYVWTKTVAWPWVRNHLLAAYNAAKNAVLSRHNAIREDALAVKNARHEAFVAHSYSGMLERSYQKISLACKRAAKVAGEAYAEELQYPYSRREARVSTTRAFHELNAKKSEVSSSWLNAVERHEKADEALKETLARVYGDSLLKKLSRAISRKRSKQNSK